MSLSLVLLCACLNELKIDPKIEGDGHYLAGTSAYLKGDFAEAHTQFDEVKRVNPADPRLPAAEGELLAAEGKVPEAIAAFEEASRLDPKRATNWSRLASLYAMRTEPEKAGVAVKKALALNAKDFDAYEVAGNLALKAGSLEEAVKNWVLASESAPDANRAALVQKATAVLMKAHRSEDALAVLRRAREKGIVSGDLQSELGDRLVDAGKPDEAISAYTEAARLNVKDPTLWQLVGELQLKHGRVAEAVAAFRESIKVQDRAVAHVALARICQKTKDEACIAHELDAALGTASGEELLETLDLSDLLVSVGRQKDALTLLKAVSEEPDLKANTALQLRVAKLAKGLKDAATMKAACARVGRGTNCP